MFAGVAVQATPAVIDGLRLDPVVSHIEADQVITLDAAESFSPTIVTQAGPPSWGLDRIDQRSLPLSNSYSYNGAGAGVTAYIVDSGIRADHVDFGGRVRSGFTTVFDGFGTDDCAGSDGHGLTLPALSVGRRSASPRTSRWSPCGCSTAPVRRRHRSSSMRSIG